jgi:hypothetical protein
LCFQRQQSRQRRRNRRLCIRPPSVPHVRTQHVGLPADTSTVRQNFLSGLDGTIRAAPQPIPPGTRNETANLVRGVSVEP